MKLFAIAPLAIVAILSSMVVISSAAPAVEVDNNCAVEADNNSAGSKCKCKLGCTKEYNPRCAKLGDGEYRTFGNPCMYEAYKCTHPWEKVKLISESACPKPTPTCPVACTKEYDPVCAKLGNGKYQTFGNQCTYEVYMCEHPKEKTKLISKTACPEEPPTIACDVSCPKEDYGPVCVKLGNGKYKTFDSKCGYVIYVCEHPTENTELISKTACPKEPTPICEKACMDSWLPVCAAFQDGRVQTFGNQCELNNAMCGRPDEKVDVTKGECPK
ncbi:hypothetical protein BGZ96_005717 [Linnemannia gamsii]|uniref:Kazal-like domain-containing protein n=1 Tax=Linnemannia gamsii TaxID=64522 RepID=A0ABQ7K637_9FUNG|nr:hypothetical protein BGZ96_005717 [Linnemannia gamsii]